MRAPKKTVRHARELRRALTRPEVLLWSLLRHQALAGLRFRRQHPIGPYVLDFFCPSRRLCVEIDGRVHDSREQASHDARRTAFLAEQGIAVIRLAAADLLDPARREGAITAIAAACGVTARFD